MKTLGAIPRLSVEMIELFADRERLTGTARERFRAVLNATLVPALARSSSHWRLWGLLPLVFAPLALGLFRLFHDKMPPGWYVVGCIAYSCIGVAFALGYRRAREISRADVETNWATYCALFRPALLELLPGLLDRNLAEDRSERVTVELKRAQSVDELWRERDEELWSASLCGLGLGAAVMMICCTLIDPAPYFLLIPLPLAVATVVVWVERNRREVRRIRGHLTPTTRHITPEARNE